MVLGDVDERRRRATALGNELAAMDGPTLAALVDRAPVSGWGSSEAATVGDQVVFVKRVPVTALEHEHWYSTRNLFRLPLYYQYGVGSAGLGACRELVTHLKTTNWVLDGSHAGFPLLLHHRLVPRGRASVKAADPDSWIDGGGYVKYWAGSKRIGSFIEARAAAPYELWLVLEHVPHTLHEWLGGAQAQAQAADVVDQLVDTIRFLHSHGVFHFDAHYGNVVTDGASTFLTDFGLASDRAFHLSPDEHAFLDRHQHYDYGEAIYSLGAVLLGLLGKLPADERGALARRYLPDGGRIDQDVVVGLLVRNIDDVVASGELGVSPGYAEVLRRYAEVILFMNAFFGGMRANRKKNTPFDDAALAKLLRRADVAT